VPRGDPSGSGMVIADRKWHQYGFRLSLVLPLTSMWMLETDGMTSMRSCLHIHNFLVSTFQNILLLSSRANTTKGWAREAMIPELLYINVQIGEAAMKMTRHSISWCQVNSLTYATEKKLWTSQQKKSWW
jgi:hypothetical protein